MGDEVPRRLRRFYRIHEKPTESEVRQRTSELALGKVDSFRDRHNRYPQGKELEEISKSVFEQLKLEMAAEDESSSDIATGLPLEDREEESFLDQRRKRRSQLKRTRKDEKKSEAKKDGAQKPDGAKRAGGEAEAEAGIEQDFDEAGEIGEEPGEIKEAAGLDEGESESPDLDNIKKLAGMEELASLGKELGASLEDDSELVEKDLETGTSCPRCSSQTEDLIYCPNCGDAFCNHCAKGVNVQQDYITYACPNCSHEFKKKK